MTPTHHTTGAPDMRDTSDDVQARGVEGRYDPLRTLREVHAILSEPAWGKKGRERRRTNAILAMAGTLGYHDALARQSYDGSGS